MGWVPGPRYLLRRYLILRQLEDRPPLRVLEIGSGGGDLLLRLALRGHECVGVETSEQARAEATTRLEGAAGRVELKADLSEVEGQFDLLVSCEVLEHIEDDHAALGSWVTHLRPGGRALLSVPAHMRRWGAGDVWAGHYRRYEREELLQLVQAAGLTPEFVACYGFPLANWIEPVRHQICARRLTHQKGMTPLQHTARSGVQRGLAEGIASFVLNGPLIFPFFWTQLLFLKGEFGNGYLITARVP